MIFRSATPDDAAEIATFMTRNFLAAYGHCSTPENVQKAVSDYYGIEAQHADLANERIINCLCIIDDKITGLAQVKPSKAGAPARQFELNRFYVESLYHGKGIAPVLMQRTLALVRAQAGESLILSVWQESPQAIRFYQKHGFEIRGDTIFMVGDDPKDDWLMVKQL